MLEPRHVTLIWALLYLAVGFGTWRWLDWIWRAQGVRRHPTDQQSDAIACVFMPFLALPFVLWMYLAHRRLPLDELARIKADRERDGG